MGVMKRRFPRFNSDADRLPLTEWMDNFQELYTNARRAQQQGPESSSGSQQTNNKSTIPRGKVQTKKTFVEIFNDLDENGDGFISEEEFGAIFKKGYLEADLTDKERSDLFASADIIGTGRLNLFEFMSVMRKIAEVGIQEIGYGYFPLAWASLTAYWLSIGMAELGQVLSRLPDTFYLSHDGISAANNLPQIVASPEVVHATQVLIVAGSLPFSIALTQKLCDDNKIGGIRFGLHAAIQVAGAALTLYLMLSPNPLMTATATVGMA